MTSLKFIFDRSKGPHEFEKVLRESILLGLYMNGEYLPSIEELSGLYTLSKYAIQNCLDHLESEGLLIKKRKKGYYVQRTQHLNHVFESLSSVQNIIEAAGFISSFQVTTSEVVPFQSDLHGAFSQASKVLKLEKLYRANDRVVLNQVCYYPLSKFPNLEFENITNQPIYEVLMMKYGLKIKGARKHLDALRLTRDEQAKLETVNAIGSRIYGYVYDESNEVFEIFDNISSSELVLFESTKILK